jgi:hypothetical protein
MKNLIDIIDTTNEPNILQTMQWGGSRPNSGAKQKYGEPTKIVTFRIPESKIHEIKKLINQYLSEHIIKK